MISKILKTVGVVAAVALPSLTLAATYGYVNTMGTMGYVQANTPAEALVLPKDIAAHSGVIVITNNPDATQISPSNPTSPTNAPLTIGTVAGAYTVDLPAADTPGRKVVLNLNQNGIADLATDYNNGQNPVVENGTWFITPGNQVEVNLIANAGQVYSPAHVIIFNKTGMMLDSVQYDTSLYGSTGLHLMMQSTTTPSL